MAYRCDSSFPHRVIYCLSAQDGDGSQAGEPRFATVKAVDDATSPRRAIILLFALKNEGFAPLAPGIIAEAIELVDVPESDGVMPGHWTAS